MSTASGADAPTALALVRRVPAAAWVILGAAALLLPRLGTFGLWEPWEVTIADAVRARPQDAGARLVAAIAGALGGGEAALRATSAITALGALLATFWAGAGLFGRRAALLGVAALATMPLFTLEARHLTSDMPLVLALALALGGLGRFAFATDGRHRWIDLAVGVVALGLGQAFGGTLVGLSVPLLALGGVVVVLGPGRIAGARPARIALLVLAGAGVLSLGGLLRAQAAGVPSAYLGGMPQMAPPGLTFEMLVRQMGFGLFPWSALAVIALARPLAGSGDAEAGDRRGAAGLFLLFFATLALALGTLRVHLVGSGRFVALAAVALAVGVLLDEALSQRLRQPVMALLAVAGTMVIARDIRLAPEELVSVHLPSKVKWPVEMTLGSLPLLVGAAVSAGLILAIATGRRIGVHLAVGVALLASALLTHQLVPALSRHLSSKPILDSYHRVARPGEPLARYRVEATQLAADTPVLPGEPAVIEHLRRTGRAFVLAATEELASLDAALKTAGVPYSVLDASSRLLLLSNRLDPGAEDVNPLRRHVFMPRTPDERPPWPAPRVPRKTVFADSIELIGADFPTSVRRPGKFGLTLQFKVHKRPPAGHGIFVHLSMPGHPLVNGDHQPVGGALPTTHWVPGEYVRDHFDLDMPLVTTPAGTYDLHIGIWPGGNRPGIPITSGETDGHDRCPLGRVEVK